MAEYVCFHDDGTMSVVEYSVRTGEVLAFVHRDVPHLHYEEFSLPGWEAVLAGLCVSQGWNRDRGEGVAAFVRRLAKRGILRVVDGSPRYLLISSTCDDTVFGEDVPTLLTAEELRCQTEFLAPGSFRVFEAGPPLSEEAVAKILNKTGA